MILLSALFTALSLAAASASLDADMHVYAALWAFSGGWFGSRTLRHIVAFVHEDEP